MIVVNVADFREAARTRLPRFLFEYIDGGSYAEVTLRRNVEDLSAIALRQRVLRDVVSLGLSVELFGHKLALPVALAQIGLAGLNARRGDYQAARAAETAGIPFTLSTVSVCDLGEVARAASKPLWFQLYMIRDRAFMRDLLAKAAAANCSALVFAGRYASAGQPLPRLPHRPCRSARPQGRGLAVHAGSPAARLGMGRRPLGAPPCAWQCHPGAQGQDRDRGLFAWMRNNFDPSIGWKDLDFIRSEWKGPLIIKGLLDPEYAREAAKVGADGIVVSNHGGRQLDGVLSTARALPPILRGCRGRPANRVGRRRCALGPRRRAKARSRGQRRPPRPCLSLRARHAGPSRRDQDAPTDRSGNEGGDVPHRCVVDRQNQRDHSGEELNMASTHHDPMTSSEHWRNTILAGLANYIDAGSIVAGSVALALWKTQYGLSDAFIGLIGAFSANAISAGIGALIGGMLCDRFGRKTIYQYDMLFYAFGMLFLVFASAPWMIIAGFLLVGLAVGADIPASWSLIAEQAPDKRRAAHSGVAQVLWYLGPVVVLFAAYFLRPFGIDGIRWLFIHLAVLALALTFLRSRMRESLRWEESNAERGTAAIDWAQLYSARYLGAMLYLIAMYGLWNLWAGYNGFFTPYLIEQNNLPQWAETVIPASYFGVGIVSILAIFMTLGDRVNQRALFGISAVLHVLGMALLAVFGFKLEIVIVHILIMGMAGGFGAQSFFQLWSAELFPTAIRSTAQGITFAIVRIGLGIWSLAVPALASTDFATLAWILTGFLVASGVIGFIWAPRNEGKSLEQIQAERAG